LQFPARNNLTSMKPENRDWPQRTHGNAKEGNSFDEFIVGQKRIQPPVSEISLCGVCVLCGNSSSEFL
jgi:hypothetical protein